MSCIKHFSSEENLEKHRQDCMVVNGVQAVKLPEEGSCKELTNLRNTLDVSFIIYLDLADLESILVPLEIDPSNTSKTIKIHKHIPCSFGYNVVTNLTTNYPHPIKCIGAKIV